MSNLRPRRCVIEKRSSGYGFHLHGEKGETGQFIRLVEPDSPAAAAGLLAGDQLSFVNGVCVAGESHQQVVARIRATVGSLELIVVDAETAELLKKNNLDCCEEYVNKGIPLTGSDSNQGEAAESNGGSRRSTPTPGENENISLQRLSVKDSKLELRPRLCSVRKGATGYGFNLHSEKTKPGQYIRAVDQDSPAEKAGLKPKDKIIQVNSMSVVSMQHSEVVAAIKAGGDETSLLVVDPETDAFFSSCNVTPTEAHLTGPLPEPVSNEGAEEQLDKTAALKTKVSVRASTSSSSSTDSLLPTTACIRLPESCEAPAEEADAGLSLSISLAQAKEKARQKRAAKKAPAMDWSKRNELFSNL